ncbi:hypothetical protein UlMin_014136 [Ulmus minor]
MPDNCDNDAGDGGSVTASLVITSGTLRYVIISIAIFISNKAEEPEPAAEVDHVRIDINGEEEDDTERNDQRQSPAGAEGDHVIRIVRDKDLRNLQRLGNVDPEADDGRTKVLEVSIELIPTQNQADDGQTREWKAIKRKGFSYFLLHALNSYTIYTLFVTFGLLLAIEMIKQGPEAGWHDGAAVLIAIFVLVTFTSVANFYHERKMMKRILNDNKKLEVNVERNGKVQSVIISDVKERDIVHLKEGDHVPADGLITDSQGLTLDDVFNSEITRDQNVYAGSKVMGGSGLMTVTSIGAGTALGEIPSMSVQDPNENTLLQDLLDKPYQFMEKFGLSVSVLILVVVLIRLPLCKKYDCNNNGFPEIKGHSSMKFLMTVLERIFVKPEGKISSLVSALVRLVILIQHGMALVIVFCLTHWNTKLDSELIETRNLSACGTMGLTTVIFFDATGGVLCKPMEVEEFWLGEKDISQEGHSETGQMVLEKLRQGIGLWLVPEISVLSQRNDLPVSWVKSKWGWSEDTLAGNEKIIRYRRSISSKKSFGVLMRKIGNQGVDLHLHWKGPASTILDMCTHFFDSRGEMHDMGTEQKELFEKVIERMEGKGLRPVAFAFAKTEEEELKKEGLSLLAIAGLKYPCKEEIRSLVGSLRSAGLTIKLVSEDESPIVRAIAWDLGVLQPDGSDHDVRGDLHPKDKLLMVKESQDNGQIVAFWGGFTARDILALREADLGITQLGRCSVMAREFSDISLGNLYSLTVVRKYGRCVFQGIRKFYQLQLTASIAGFLISLVSTMVSGDSPLTSLQMIWVNSILNLLGGFMMVMELPLPPNSIPEAKRNQSLITKSIWANIAVQVLYQFSLVLLISQFVDRDMIFTMYTLCQLFNLFKVINLAKMEVVKIVLQSYWFLVSLVAVLLIQFLAVQLGEGILSSTKLTEKKWTLCFLLSALSLVFDWAIKRLFFFLQQHSSGSMSVRSYFWPSNARSWSPFLVFFPFSTFVLFSASYYFHPDIALTFR